MQSFLDILIYFANKMGSPLLTSLAIRGGKLRLFRIGFLVGRACQKVELFLKYSALSNCVLSPCVHPDVYPVVTRKAPTRRGLSFGVAIHQI